MYIKAMNKKVRHTIPQNCSYGLNKQMKNENKKCLLCSLLGRSLSCLQLFKDSKRLVEHCSVIDAHKTSIGTGLEVDTHALTSLEILTTEEVTYGLYTYTKLVSNTVHATIGQ